MDIEVNRIYNELNFYKRAKLLVETCTKTMYIVYQLLYKWPDKAPYKLADHLNEIPFYQVNNKILHDLLRGQGEITKIHAMRNNKEEMKAFDISFYFKLIQFATNNEQIKPPNHDVWGNKCPENLKNELEYLLFVVKNDRNDFNHKDNKFLNLKDEDIVSFCGELHQRLPLIIQQAGIKAETDPKIIVDICENLTCEIACIQSIKQISSSDEEPILKIMIEKDLMPILKELNRCFSNELKSYCPPEFMSEDTGIINIEKLLYENDAQFICINAEAGCGKTSLTKFVQRQLLEKIENLGDDFASLEIPIRVACRNITGRNICEFLEDEIPILGHYSSTSCVRKLLKRFNIRWIIDGYDERTAEFSEFFQCLLLSLPSTPNHKIILTSRPDSLKEIKQELKNIKMCDVSIESFANHQVLKVAEKYLGKDKAHDFIISIQDLKDETLKFVKTPINLNLCLELWAHDPKSFDENMMTLYKLYDKILEKHIDLLFHRHKNRTEVTCAEDLKRRIKDWYLYLCGIVAESAFGYELRISEPQKVKLMKKASEYGLLGTYCLSTFFNFETSSHGPNYFIKHKTQKEVLVCVYLKHCEDNELKAVAQQDEITDLLWKVDPFLIFNFLMECCNAYEFSRIFIKFLETYPKLQRSKCLLQIKDGNEDYFHALKNKIRDSGQFLVLHVYYDNEVMELLKVLEDLIPGVSLFKLVIGFAYYSKISMHKEINDFLNKHKHRISFDLKLKVKSPHEVISVIHLYKKEGNLNLIKEIYFDFNNKKRKNNLLKLGNLEKASFYVDCRYYSTSFLAHFASSPQILPNTINPMQIVSPRSLSIFDKSCHVHFYIESIEDPSNVIEDVCKVIPLFQSISVNLNFSRKFLACTLDITLLQRLTSSSVQVKQLIIWLEDCSKYPNLLQLVNCVDLERLELKLWDNEESTSFSNYKHLFDIWDFGNGKLREIKLWIKGKSPLILIYDKLPSNLISKTIIEVNLCELSCELERNITYSNYMNQFRQIQVNNVSYNDYLSASEIERLRSISKSLVSWRGKDI